MREPVIKVSIGAAWNLLSHCRSNSTTEDICFFGDRKVGSRQANVVNHGAWKALLSCVTICLLAFALLLRFVLRTYLFPKTTFTCQDACDCLFIKSLFSTFRPVEIAGAKALVHSRLFANTSFLLRKVVGIRPLRSGSTSFLIRVTVDPIPGEPTGNLLRKAK